jgi:hypothetical protein
MMRKTRIYLVQLGLLVEHFLHDFRLDEGVLVALSHMKPSDYQNRHIVEFPRWFRVSCESGSELSDFLAEISAKQARASKV